MERAARGNAVVNIMMPLCECASVISAETNILAMATLPDAMATVIVVSGITAIMTLMSH